MLAAALAFLLISSSCPAFCLQVATTGKEARGPTVEEVLKKVLAEPIAEADGKGVRKLIVTVDHASIHEFAKEVLPAKEGAQVVSGFHQGH